MWHFLAPTSHSHLKILRNSCVLNTTRDFSSVKTGFFLQGDIAIGSPIAEGPDTALYLILIFLIPFDCLREHGFECVHGIQRSLELCDEFEPVLLLLEEVETRVRQEL